jgi:hypothetical protein
MEAARSETIPGMDKSPQNAQMIRAAAWLLAVFLAVIASVRWHQTGSLTLWAIPVPVLLGIALKRADKSTF